MLKMKTTHTNQPKPKR